MPYLDLPQQQAAPKMAAVSHSESIMRRIILTVLAAAALQVQAAPKDKDADVNIHYKETAADKAARVFKEADLPLPAFPDAGSGNWFDIYVNESYGRNARILLDSIQPASDGTVRYILNERSKSGHDNLTAEAMFCSGSSFGYGDRKRSSYKIYGFGDTVNRRWIAPRNPVWKNTDTTLNRDKTAHGILFNAFCVDGTPKSAAALRDRIIERAGKNGKRLSGRKNSF